jgi:hypothetical protein
MSQIAVICLFSLSSILAYLFSISAASSFAPQFIALIAIVSIIFIKQKKYLIFFISLLVNVIVFSTNGLSSPVFFLVYFLLFTVAFQNPPSTTLAVSLILVILLSQSLNSAYSLLPLLSLLLVTPLAYFIGHQYLETVYLEKHLSNNETDILLWLSLKFKTGVCQIIDTASLLLSQPQLTLTQKEQIRQIKNSAKNLLNSAKDLSREVDEETDDEP